MSKVNVGDYVHIDYTQECGVVIEDRGGRVAPWKIKLNNGKITYASSRDCTVIKPSATPSKITADEKIDLLLEHLGLEVRVEPEVRKITKQSPPVKPQVNSKERKSE